MIVAAGLFLINAVTGYLAGRYYDARVSRSPGAAVAWGAALDTAVGVDFLGFMRLGWIALPVAVAGGALGTWLSFRSFA